MGAIRYEGLATQLCYAAVFLLLSLFPPRLSWVENARLSRLCSSAAWSPCNTPG
jgi:hypothetical protein